MGSSKGARLRKAERRRQILLDLKLKPHVRITELALQFDVTTETIRRDLDALSREGQLSRDHGGASAPHPSARSDLDERSVQRIKERQRIGQIAASLVADGDVIMIDAGSTTLEFARFLAYAGTRVFVITNSLQVAMALGHNAARVVLTPGDYVPEEAAVVGVETVKFLSNFNADACFLGASAIGTFGVTEAIDGFDHVKRAMLERSRQRHFLIDSAKVGKVDTAMVARPDEFETLITDKELPADMAAVFQAHSVEIMTP